MGQQKLVTAEVVESMHDLATTARRVTADGRVTPREQLELNQKVNDALGKVVHIHNLVGFVRLLTGDVRDVRNFETKAARAGVRNGLRLINSGEPLDAA